MVITKTKISIVGIEELDKKAEQIKKNLYAILGEAVLAGSDIIRDAAKEKARKKSGEMADGIVSTVTWDRKAPVAFAGVGMDKAKNNIFVKMSKNGKRYYYPASIEYGHPGAPAYPFMRPAMDKNKNKNKVRKAIRDRVKAIIDGVR